jgi:NTE family protein
LEKIKKSGEAAARRSLPQLQELKQRYALSRPYHQQDNLIMKPVISSINIVGNKKQPTYHIVHFLGLKPGDQLEIEDLNIRIMKLYGLGYFENILYDIFPDGANQISLRIEIKELPQNKMRFGLKYNNLHKLVAITGLHFTNVLIPGLHIENEVQLIGSTQMNTKIYYPAWDQKLIIYPLFSLGYKNIPTRIFDGAGHRIASYNDRSWYLGFGLGCNIAKWINAEVVYNYEQMNIRPSVALPDPEIFPSWEDSLKKFCAEVSVDTLDDILLPKKGFLLKARFEGSYAKWNSDVSYTRGDIASDFYMTFFQKHTVRLFGYLGRSSSTTPVYKYFNNGRHEKFVGMRYDQLNGNKMNILRLDYRYKFHEFLYFKLMGNVALNFEYRQPGVVFQPKRLWGAGAGIKIHLPFGPMEFIYSLGSKSLLKPNAVQSVFYISLGTKF